MYYMQANTAWCCIEKTLKFSLFRMKTNISLFFVSFMVLFSGCQSSYYDGKLTLSGGGMTTQYGTLDHSEATVENPYPNLTMSVKVVVGTLFQYGYSGFRWNSHRADFPGESITARPPCMVVQRENVVLLAEWYDAQNQRVGSASTVYTGLGYQTCAWHVRWRPTMGQHDNYWRSWNF
jgi:hypothetical protein